MGFKWPVLRREVPGSTAALLTAAALTALGCVMLSGSLAPLYRVGPDVSPTRDRFAHEVITFVSPVRAPVPRIERPATAAAARQRRRAVGRPPTPRPAIARAIVNTETPARGDSSVSTATHAASPSPHPPAVGVGSGLPAAMSFVVAPPSRFGRSAALGPTQRDSVLRRLAGAVPFLATTRRMTQGERDTIWREEARRQAMWRDQGRPIPLVLGGGGISLPLFSRGPSRERRMRDSVVHRDNLLRLQRIAERARIKPDTARGVAAGPDRAGTTAPAPEPRDP